MKELVHTRDISIRTFDLGEGRIMIEGRLFDNRYRERPGEHFEDGSTVVHDLALEVTVRGRDMMIEKVEARMPHHPREGCTDVIPWMKKLEGLQIVGGFTQKVREIVGGVKGCAHLTSLFLVIGPAAVQGIWAAYGRDRKEWKPDDDRIKKIINTCYLWREDGPILKELQEMFEKKAS